VNSKELREQRAKLIHDARVLVEEAKAEDRTWSDEDEARFDQMMADADGLRKDYERIEALEGAERDVAASRGVASEDDQLESRESDPEAETRAAAFSRYLREGDKYLSEGERRALQTDNDIQAGYLVPEEQFINELIKTKDDQTFVRQWARKFSMVNAKSLGVPYRSAALSSAAWGGEIVAPTADSTYAVGKRELYPQYAAASILVSRDLLRNSVQSVDSIVAAEFGRDFAELEEDAYFTGNGSGQPLGVFTASSDGISTSRDYSTGNSSTEVKFDGLIGAKWNLKPAYWPSAKWLFDRTVATQIAIEKDGEGNYLWRENVRVGEPDQLLGLPAFISERAPATMTSGLYVGILGDFSYYWIADSLDMELMRLDELNARTNQVEFIGRLKTDGMPVLEEAFSRVKLG